MARYRFSSARRVSHLSEFDALARKDTVWSCVSLAMSVATPEQYNDLVDMFNLSTPVSPLPSTPVASPSHDGTMEPSMVSLEPLRDPPQIPVKKVDSQRRSRERRPRYPRRSYPRVF
ncbi:hypothetical protein TNCV_3917071 [Trichonephila clavipes]|nr:hypothetical protein TNCV_3917071 [Trichonephila clavipes]